MSREECHVAYPSGRVLQPTCALIPSCSDPTSDGQFSVFKCHPWIGIADTQYSRIYNRVQSHTYYIECLKRELITIIWLKVI